jgi:hypothetical protein
MIYNDGYRDMLGSAKHPGAMGLPVAEVWPEIWADVGPIFAQVLATGEPTWTTDQGFLMHRSGFVEETYFTYSYSPLRDETGSVRGVLDIATETTDRVVDRRRLGCLSALSTGLQAAVYDVGEVGRVTIDALGADIADVSAADVYLRDGDDVLLLATTRQRPSTDAASTDLLLKVSDSLDPVGGRHDAGGTAAGGR